MKNPIKFFFSKEESDTKVANNRLLSYAIGLFGQNMNYSFVSQRLFTFMHTVLGVQPERTGIITGVSSIWDAVNDPIVGTIVDSRKYKPGNKMRPLILYTSPLIGILTALMFINMKMSATASIIYILVIFLLYDLLYSFQDVALWGLLPLSSPSSVERARVSQWVTIGAGAGASLSGAFPFLHDILVGQGMSESGTYLTCAVFFGFIGMLISLTACRMKEKVRYETEKKQGVFESLASLRYNKTLLIICFARLMGNISLALPWEYFFWTDGMNYRAFGIEISGGTMQVLHGLIPGIPGAIAIFFATKLAKKLGGMKKILVVSEILQIICRVAAFAVGANGRFLSFGWLCVVWIFLAIYNIPVNMKDIAHRSLISDSIDEVELKTGERTEGIVFSMQNFVSKLGTALAKLIQGYALKALGFVNKEGLEGARLIAAQDKASPFFKYRWPVFMLGPVIGSVLYLVTILFLKDNGNRTAEIEEQLKAVRLQRGQTQEAAVSKETN